MVELRRLRYFLAVADERNFTRAAERLHVAQPALSRQVKLLEEELGVELVRRTTHSFELTEAGRVLHERGPAVVQAAEELALRMRRLGAGELGSVVVAYGTSAGYDTAPRLLAAVRERLPELGIATRVATSAEIVAAVLDGSIDAGIVRCPPAVDGIESVLLRAEPQGVLVRADHPLAAASEAHLEDLGDETVLLHPRQANPGHYDAVLALLRAAGIEPPITHRDVTFDLRETPVAEARAVAIVGESASAGIAPGLVWIPLTPRATLPVELLVGATERSPALGPLIDVAEHVASELGWR